MRDFGYLLLWSLIVATALCVPTCNTGKVASNNEAPLVEAKADVQAIVGLLNKVTKLETTIGELKTEIGTLQAGRDIYSVKIGGITSSVLLFLYVISERFPWLRGIKDTLKGRNGKGK